MNSNNWLSFPLSPTHSSLPPHLQSSSQPNGQFSLGLVTDNLDNPFHGQEWNLINTHGGSGGEVPKIADFLGVSKSESQSDLVSFNHDQLHHHQECDYLYGSSNIDLVPAVQSSVMEASSGGGAYHEFHESANNLQSLTLSMGSSGNKAGSSAACETSTDNSTSSTTNVVETTPRRTVDTFGQRTSIYRGVTRHRWTGRYEAHLWDNSCRREGQSRKGRQVYLGGYDKEDKAARAYDLAALKYWGTSTTTNFPINNYEKEVEEMKNMTRQEFVASIRRKSSGFSRGASMYRGVTRHHQHGRWQARIGRVAGNKDLYLGTFSTEEEAAEAYDIAAIKFRGLNAVTNFDMNRYDVKSIMESNTLPIGGGAAKRLKEAQAIESSRKREEMLALSTSFQYGGGGSTSSTAAGRLQAYPLMPLQPLEPLALQSQPDMSGYAHDTSSFHQSYIQTQLQLHHHQQQQQQSSSSYLQYNAYNNAGLFNGLMNMNVDSSSSSVMDGGGYQLGMGLNSPAAAVGGPPEELALVKVDYDMPSGGGYGDWSAGDSVQGSNGTNVFTMWND